MPNPEGIHRAYSRHCLGPMIGFPVHDHSEKTVKGRRCRSNKSKACLRCLSLSQYLDHRGIKKMLPQAEANAGAGCLLEGGGLSRGTCAIAAICVSSAHPGPWTWALTIRNEPQPQNSPDKFGQTFFSVSRARFSSVVQGPWVFLQGRIARCCLVHVRTDAISFT